ncbi:hypothetical protein FOL47_002466, partial [Perkinsus chesapeaki]
MASNNPRTIINDESIIYPTIKTDGTPEDADLIFHQSGLDTYRYLVWGSNVGTEDHDKLIHRGPFIQRSPHPMVNPSMIIDSKAITEMNTLHWCPLLSHHLKISRPLYPSKIITVKKSIWNRFEQEVGSLSISKPGAVSPYIWSSLSPVLRYYILHGETDTILSMGDRITIDLVEELDLLTAPTISDLGTFARYISVVAIGIANGNFIFDDEHHMAIGLTPMHGFDLQQAKSTINGCIPIPRDIYECVIKINYISKMLLFNCVLGEDEDVDVKSVVYKSGGISRDLILMNVGHISHLSVSSNDLVTIDRLINGMYAYHKVETIVGYNIAALEADTDLE